MLWPDSGLTKQGLPDHYFAVWDRMKPCVIDRPLSLPSAPDGIGEVKDPKDRGGPVVIRDFDGLAALVQFGVVEVHLWGSTVAALEKPDQMIFDLDPDKGVGRERVVEAATEIRKRLIALKQAPFLKSSGGRGLHVVVPLKPEADWKAVKEFSHAFAELLASDAPDRYTADMSKKARPGRIFVD